MAQSHPGLVPLGELIPCNPTCPALLRNSADFSFWCSNRPDQWFLFFWQEPEDIPPQEERSIREQGKSLGFTVPSLLDIVWRAAWHAKCVSCVLAVALALGHQSKFDVSRWSCIRAWLKHYCSMTEYTSNVSRCQFVAISSDSFGHATSRILISVMNCLGGMHMRAILVTEKYAIELVC